MDLDVNIATQYIQRILDGLHNLYGDASRVFWIFLVAYGIRVLQGYSLRILHVEKELGKWDRAGFVFSMKVSQPPPNADLEVRMRSLICSKVFFGQDARFRVGRMIFRGFRLRSRSGLTTTLVVPDYYTPGYVADAKSILDKILGKFRHSIDGFDTADEHEWKKMFRKILDDSHEEQFRSDRHKSLWWSKRHRRGWNTVHYPLPGYSEIRACCLPRQEDKNVSIHEWAWRHANHLEQKIEFVAKTIRERRSSTGRPHPVGDNTIARELACRPGDDQGGSSCVAGNDDRG